MTCIKKPKNLQASLRHSVPFIYLLRHLIELLLYIYYFGMCILHERVVDRPVTATAHIYLFFGRSRPHRHPEVLAHSQLKFLAVLLLPPPPRPLLLSLLHALAGCGIRISIGRPCPSIPAASLGASALKKKRQCSCQRGPSKCTNELEC